MNEKAANEEILAAFKQQPHTDALVWLRDRESLDLQERARHLGRLLDRAGTSLMSADLVDYDGDQRRYLRVLAEIQETFGSAILEAVCPRPLVEVEPFYYVLHRGPWRTTPPRWLLRWLGTDVDVWCGSATWTSAWPNAMDAIHSLTRETDCNGPLHWRDIEPMLDEVVPATPGAWDDSTPGR